MQDFSINISDIKSIEATLNIQKTSDTIKAYIVFLDGQYKVTSSDNTIILKDLTGNHNYIVVVVAIDENYNSNKSTATFKTNDIMYLYKDGVENIKFTGNNNSISSVEKRKNGLYFKCDDTYTYIVAGCSFTSETFDSSNYKNLTVEIDELTSSEGNECEYYVGIYNSSNNYIKREIFSGNFNGTDKKKIVFDLTSINEKIYIVIGCCSAPMEKVDTGNWNICNPYTGIASGLVTSVYLGM